MTHAELLRSHADAALREGGMYYSGEYLSRVATEAESLEAENVRLRELCSDMLHDAMENVCSKAYWCGKKSWQTCNDGECGNRLYVEMARDLGVEVP